MAQNVNPTFVKTPNRGLAQISTGTGTGTLTLYTGGANGSKIVSISATQSSTGTVNFNLFVTSAAVTYTLNVQSIATNSFAQFLPSGGQLPLDSDGNFYVILASSADVLSLQAATTLPSVGSLASFIAIGGDF
jgi:hypothetical protein